MSLQPRMASTVNSILTCPVLRLYNDPTFSDIKIRQIYKGQVKEYAAHKAVLCAHSGWFMAALTGRFKV